MSDNPQRLTLKSSELRPGDIVWCHGMRCLIDRDIREARESEHGPVFYTNALVLNRDDIPTERVPLSFTETTTYPSRGMAPEPEGTHRWAIQGNDLVRWQVDRDPNYGRQRVDQAQELAPMPRDPWANDPDRTTRHHAVSIPPPAARILAATDHIGRGTYDAHHGSKFTCPYCGSHGYISDGPCCAGRGTFEPQAGERLRRI